MANEVGGKEECMKSQKLREVSVVVSFSFSFFHLFWSFFLKCSVVIFCPFTSNSQVLKG